MFTTAQPLSLPDVALLVAMVNPGGRSGRAWPTKARLILALATYPDGGWWNAPDAERLTGVPRNFARELLAELEAQRVIVRRGRDGHERSKVFWCELNPDWRRWVVEWALEERDVELRLGWNQTDRVRHPLERLFSRRIAPRYASVIAVLGHRDSERQRADLAPFSRYLGTANPDAPSRSLPPRFRRGGSPGGVLTGHGDEEISSSEAAGSAVQEEEGRSHTGWPAVHRAYATKAGVRFLYRNSAPERALAALVAVHGDGPVLDAIGRAPDELGVRLLVDHLPELLAGEPTEVPMLTAVDSAARVSHLERMIATYRAEGVAPPKDLLDELAQWQTGPDATPQEVSVG